MLTTTLFFQDYSKKYGSDEEELARLNIWSANRVYVQQHNANADMYGYTVAMNEFADMVSGCGFERILVTFAL